MKRRKFIKQSAAAGIGLGFAPSLIKAGKNQETFCFVHLTDQHVYDKRSGTEGYRACIQSINDLPEKPDLVVMGGDMVFDGNYNLKTDYLRWINQFKSISDQLRMPWYPCMGNHDTFGLSSRRKTEKDDPDIGKNLIQKALNWPETFYSFNHKGWHFVVLDCIEETDTENGRTYIPRISDKQLQWLRNDLGRAAGMPIIVVTHIAVFYLKKQADGDTEAKAMVPGMVIENNRELRLILERHNVTAVLQGHCHHIEEFRYNGVRYITSAAGSGAWWAGDWVGDPPGYTLFECGSKGQLSWKHIGYRWQARLEPNDELERERQHEFDAFKARQQQLFLEETGKL